VHCQELVFALNLDWLNEEVEDIASAVRHTTSVLSSIPASGNFKFLLSYHVEQIHDTTSVLSSISARRNFKYMLSYRVEKIHAKLFCIH
jgi:hypothetical protein